MRIFYTGSDIEDLAGRGIRQLEVGPGVALTDSARERAEELGVKLVAPAPSNQPASKASAPAATAASGNAPTASAKGASLPAKPRGCQHGPLGAGGGAAPAGRPSQVVDQLVDAVSALKKRGG